MDCPCFRALATAGGKHVAQLPGRHTDNDIGADSDRSDSPPTTGKTVLFGRLVVVVIRRAPLFVQRLDERYADFGQIGFLAWWRCDGNLIDGGGGAVKALENVTKTTS